jgi:hypothetical protein
MCWLGGRGTARELQQGGRRAWGVERVMLYVGKLYEVASLFADPPHANSTTR